MTVVLEIKKKLWQSLIAGWNIKTNQILWFIPIVHKRWIKTTFLPIFKWAEYWISLEVIIKNQRFSLKNSIEVYDAKIIAILKKQKHLLKSLIIRVITRICICLDKFRMACNAKRIPNSSSQ